VHPVVSDDTPCPWPRPHGAGGARPTAHGLLAGGGAAPAPGPDAPDRRRARRAVRRGPSLHGGDDPGRPTPRAPRRRASDTPRGAGGVQRRGPPLPALATLDVILQIPVLVLRLVQGRLDHVPAGYHPRHVLAVHDRH